MLKIIQDLQLISQHLIDPMLTTHTRAYHRVQIKAAESIYVTFHGVHEVLPLKQDELCPE
jgi:hypothetical protein